eukprot:Seg2217.3 transcript_id=Seg2217.3/GoldUCD/mRNA.D3Y31 product="Coiled-coil-helix-coiled-coil-helix domain-containing protein 5" protein_id=Seg2217.3/GoldUCD/D3Y31
MDAIIDIVERKCCAEMSEYTACVNEHPENWLEKCSNEKKALNDCSSQHPVIKQINKNCGTEFQRYDDCLRTNSSQPQHCSAELELFSLCAESVAQLDESSNR